ncbi:MAG: phosphate ABC transporter substrate-binding protein [Oceanospirillaceae bacterium]|nr:phosphate ABC transporter substrate-binding protein [Oceanospirillaceae bacterium]MCP5334495.1 phosphate ABC transporter substrate-binding protein [Oceanospirillaceae bacterium]MCP5350800.1 phosphate ABC transporter substrate-binding protein [Oceanospirillaceae bacterium]
MVIVNPSSPLTSISEDDVQQMFLGKKKDLGSGMLLPLDQPEGSDSRNRFYSEIIKKTEIQLKSYWSRLIFTGKGQAPQVIGVDADIVNMIATNPNLIGYINADSLTDKVRAVYRHP